MARTHPPSQLPADHPDWIFRWRPLGSPFLPKAIAIAISLAAFSFLLVSVRVGVRTPDPWAPRRASVIHVGDGPDSLALARLARDEGPFPSRFEPTSWRRTAGLEDPLAAALRWQPAAYHPSLRPLPDDGPPPPEPLANPGVRVLPPLPAAPQQSTVAEPLRLMPVLDPLGGITRDELPTDLPPFPEADGKTGAEASLFLARLRADGSVIDCVALAGGDKTAGDHLGRLGRWLRSIRFPAADHDGPPVRWITVGIRFVNRSIDDGPQPE